MEEEVEEVYWRKLSSGKPKFFGRVGYYTEEEKHMRMYVIRKFVS